MNQVLAAPLPDAHKFSGSCRSMKDTVKMHDTHPERVELWPAEDMTVRIRSDLAQLTRVNV